MQDEVLILYATQTGNAALLAADTARKLRTQGLAVRQENMADVAPDILLRHDRLCAVVSTWGDGEPPDDAVDFFENLRAWDGDLKHLHFSVCALGDTCYDKYCGCGHEFHELLQQRGASSFVPLMECDIDFDKSFAEWLHSVTGALVLAAGIR